MVLWFCGTNWDTQLSKWASDLLYYCQGFTFFILSNLGEEYDGGFAYFGVNAAPDIEDLYNFPWKHWLSSRSPLRAERAIVPFQNYAWTMLNKSVPWSASYMSSGL
ncbi:MAG TPA: hypothetical protein VGO47_02865, partial [Chlamydiales bacterium]|nr:hypothetical protein [Chlamydiales bacterium]